MAGIVRGSGKQKVGAVSTVCTFYFFGFPLGLCLMFLLKMGIVGESGKQSLYLKP